MQAGIPGDSEVVPDVSLALRTMLVPNGHPRVELSDVVLR